MTQREKEIFFIAVERGLSQMQGLPEALAEVLPDNAKTPAVSGGRLKRRKL
ncbi:hypothetical protein SIAM614_17649 [Roseibium aggregatum IAM 12614]|uniref:Uncharacterized protein n=1 Tax=Roseibium aggregatum (strain ATCC 25650 / DSM 13394 / JCM 20685 / NBRC 16684 / NCIMB 2208 / IAM 12614 / B1) TaxID=384765 RepID=A0NP10_ROSAI|nr:hypothetical protein SIAM614_17649 [Roseibium aggregatum IAM 12614]